MKNYLLVGDMHVRKQDIEECYRFIQFVVYTATKSTTKARSTIIFLGDQYNDFGIARLEVMEFWDWAYSLLAEKGLSNFSLIGNHDINGDASASAMTVHKNLTNLVTKQGAIIDPENRIAGIGFTRNNDEFIKLAHTFAAQGVKTIICHAEIEGAQYDNGFYAPNGVPLASLPTGVQFISGHIHKQQEFANVWYPGSPRYLTRSDIGEVKGIWTNTGATWELVNTPTDISKPFVAIEVTEGQPIPDIPDSDRTFVDVHGSDEFIQKVCKKLPEAAKVRTFPTETRAAIEIKESEGIPVAFSKYAQQYAADKVLSQNAINQILGEVYSKCPSLKQGVAIGS